MRCYFFVFGHCQDNPLNARVYTVKKAEQVLLDSKVSDLGHPGDVLLARSSRQDCRSERLQVTHRARGEQRSADADSSAFFSSPIYRRRSCIRVQGACCRLEAQFKASGAKANREEAQHDT